MNFLVKLMIVLFISLLVENIQAQEFDDFVRKYTDANGQGYMQPLADAFGANLNSGWYHNAYIQEKGFQLYIGVTAMSAIIPEKNKTFLATTQGFFSPTQSIDAPTIFGKSETVTVDGDGGLTYSFPGGLDLNNLPMAVPNITVGSLHGTDLSVRWAAYNIGEDVGKVQILGGGIRHSIDQYFDLEPVNLAAGFFFQQFSLGNIVEANGWLANIQASYQWRLITFYGGLGYENSNLDIQYTYEADESEINFNLKGDNSIRATLGLTLNLGPVKLHGDYNLANQSLFTLGLGLGFNELKKVEE
jgi:hypothetical protein